VSPKLLAGSSGQRFFQGRRDDSGANIRQDMPSRAAKWWFPDQSASWRRRDALGNVLRITSYHREPARSSAIGGWKVTHVTKNPVFYYNPTCLGCAGLRREGENSPGPNNPVGVVWIGLSRSTRHSRGRLSVVSRARGVPWLHPSDELGCLGAGANRGARTPVILGSRKPFVSRISR